MFCTIGGGIGTRLRQLTGAVARCANDILGMPGVQQGGNAGCAQDLPFMATTPGTMRRWA